MSDDGQLAVTRHGRVLQLTITNPARRNALHPDMYATGAQTLRDASSDAAVGAIVLTGAGEHFCSGGNIKRLIANRERSATAQRQSIDGLGRWVTALNDCSKPVIAAVEGHAAGAGFSLALACDLIVAANTAQFTMAYVKIGLSPDGGATKWLCDALPRPLALELLLDGKPIGSERSYQLGLVNRLCEPGAALAVAMNWAETLATGPADAQARIKRLLRLAHSNGLADQLTAEREAFVEGLFGDECGEGLSAFLQKRQPDFSA